MRSFAAFGGHHNRIQSILRQVKRFYIIFCCPSATRLSPCRLYISLLAKRAALTTSILVRVQRHTLSLSSSSGSKTGDYSLCHNLSDHYCIEQCHNHACTYQRSKIKLYDLAKVVLKTRSTISYEVLEFCANTLVVAPLICATLTIWMVNKSFDWMVRVVWSSKFLKLCPIACHKIVRKYRCGSNQRWR